MEIKTGETLKKVLSYLGSPEKIKADAQKWYLKMGAGKWVEVQQALLYNPDRDIVLAVGLREEPKGHFQGPVIAQPRGGGEVCLPYFLHPKINEVWVGVIPQERKNMSGKHLCAIGCMNEMKLGRDEVRKQKLNSVVGLDEENFKPFVLKGTAISSDRFFFLGTAKKKEGVRFSALEIPDPRDMLEIISTSSGTQAKFKEEATTLGLNSEVIFMPWYQVSRSSADGLLQAGITRLMAYLHEKEYANH